MEESITYSARDIGRILGLPVDRTTPDPPNTYGKIVVYYGGWLLKDLRSSKAGKRWMYQDVFDPGTNYCWYDDERFRADPGYYQLLLPVPGSNRKNWKEQLEHLRSLDIGWQPAPAAVVGTALLVHLAKTKENLLRIRTHYCRCAESVGGVGRIGLGILGDNQVLVTGFKDSPQLDYLWMAAASRL